MPLNHSFLRQLRTELSRVGGDTICQALSICYLRSALEAAKSFAPIRALARPRPTAEAASLLLDFADGTSLQITSQNSRPGLPPMLVVSVARHGQPSYTQEVDRWQLQASIVQALQGVAGS